MTWLTFFVVVVMLFNVWDLVSRRAELIRLRREVAERRAAALALGDAERRAERSNAEIRLAVLEAKVASSERRAFRAGFLATVGKPGWQFDGPSAADLEPEAWESWVTQGRPEGLVAPS